MGKNVPFLAKPECQNLSTEIQVSIETNENYFFSTGTCTATSNGFSSLDDPLTNTMLITAIVDDVVEGEQTYIINVFADMDNCRIPVGSFPVGIINVRIHRCAN